MVGAEETRADQFLKTVKASLLARKGDLEGALQRAKQGCKKVLAEAGSAVTAGNHQADKETIGYGTDIDLASASTLKLKAMLIGVDEAIQRINEGVYGLCTECGEQIDSKRLDINIAVERCTPCEQELERERKRKGLPVRPNA